MPEIIIEGTIGADVEATDVRQQLEDAGGAPVTILLNSGGGSVWQGYSIHDMIATYEGHVTVKIVGLAGSIASYFMLAADKIFATHQSSVLIHDPSALTAGTSDDHAKTRVVLEGLASQLAAAYAGRMGITPEEARQKMRDEAWFFGEEIVSAGLADEMVSDPHVKAWTSTAAIAACHGNTCVAPDEFYEQAAAAITDPLHDLTSDDIQAMRMMSMTPEEYRKYSGSASLRIDQYGKSHMTPARQ